MKNKKEEKYVEYVVQDFPILGKKIVSHYLFRTDGKRNRKNIK